MVNFPFSKKMGFLAKKTTTSQKRSSIYTSPDIEPPVMEKMVGCKGMLLNPSKGGTSRRFQFINNYSSIH